MEQEVAHDKKENQLRTLNWFPPPMLRKSLACPPWKSLDVLAIMSFTTTLF